MKLFLGTLLLATLTQSGGQPVNIPVPNPSFELGYGAVNSQDLGVTPAQLQADPAHPGYFIDGVYTLTFSLVNILPPYPGSYDVEISFGTQRLCESYAWGIRTDTTITVVCPGPAYIVIDQALPGGGPVQGSKHLVLTSSVPGWQMQFSKAALTFTPN